MVKHNNVIQNTHFHKNWQRYIRTWFDQPAKKVKRREKRSKKAKQIAPRPLKKLRPVVRCPSFRYNTKLRLGRGFSFAELKEAGVSRHLAPTIGIVVDHRRRNTNEADFQRNVDRLVDYKTRLVILPRKGAGKNKMLAEMSTFPANTSREVIPFSQERVEFEARKPTEEETKLNVYQKLRKDLKDVKLKSKREKRAKEAEEKLKNKRR